MRLTDLIKSTEELKLGADMDYVLIRREGKKGEPITALSANLSAALQAPGSAGDIKLEAGDTVHIFGLALGRQRAVQPLLAELMLQTTIDLPAQQVEVSGNVRAPGIYPLESEMRVSDLIRAGGNFSEDAYVLKAELTRYSMQASGIRQVNFLDIDLNAIRRGDENADVLLKQYDYLIIKRAPEWDSNWTVDLEGEVVFPGTYRVRRNETLDEVIERSGGLTLNAFPEGAVFLRESLKESEQDQITSLVNRMEMDLATLSAQSVSASNGDSLRTGQLLLEQLKKSEAVGRLVIDLQNDVARSVGHIMVRDGDRLLIPMAQQVITVIGEAQQNSSHLYHSDLSRDDYISLSGGLTRKADKKFIYIVRANGEVVTRKRSRWPGRTKSMNIRPGDTIVVPLEINPLNPLTLWTSVTQILYQSAIAVAAISSLAL